MMVSLAIKIGNVKLRHSDIGLNWQNSDSESDHDILKVQKSTED